MKSDKKRRRGLKPTVITITHTVSSKINKDSMHIQSVTEATLEKMNCSLSLSELKSFSTVVIDDLLDNCEETFESLKVRVRLNIAITPCSPRSFFVNEVTC